MNCLSYVTYLVISFYPDASIYWLLLPSLPVSLSGGWFTINLLCCALVSDSSDRKSRSARISIVQFAQALGIGSGYLVGDIVFKYYGYRMVFAITIAVHVFAVLYSWFRFPWDFRKIKNESGNIFTPVKESMKSLRDSDQKKKVGLLCLAMVVLQFTKTVDSSVAYLYTRHQFGWGTGYYSVYVVIIVFCGAVGTSIVYPALSLFLQVDDCILGVMGSLSWVNFHLVTGFAQSDWLLYFAAALGVLRTSTNVTIRSMLSKTSDSKTNGGALFSLLASITALVPLISSPIIAWLYSSTLDTFPGTIFLVTAAVFSVNILIFFGIFVIKKEKAVK